jgi:hypothetical protein
MNRFQLFVFVDSRARRICYTISVSAAFAYALVSQFVFGRNEAKVTNETLTICFVLLLISLVSYRFFWPMSRRLIVGQGLQPRISNRYPVLFLVAGLTLSFAPLIQSYQIQTMVVNARLSLASFFVARVFASNSSEDRVIKQLNSVQNVMYFSEKNGIDADTAITERLQKQIATAVTGKNLSEATKLKAWSTLVGLATFNEFGSQNLQPLPVRDSANFDEVMDQLSHLDVSRGLRIYGQSQGSELVLGSGLGLLWDTNRPLVVENVRVVGNPTDKSFIGTTSNQTKALVRNSKIENVAQQLDNVIWTNVEFVNSLILYSDGPVFLRNVKFINCQFFFPRKSGNSSDLLNLIKESDSRPVTFASAGQN